MVSFSSTPLLVTALACVTVGWAQSPTAAAPLALEPLTVTAQKRGQALHETPLALTAYSGATLTELGLTDYASLAPLVPGFFVSTQSPGSPSLNLRGVGSDSTAPGYEARISVFHDGVAISRTSASSVEFFDLARVEVLKGPQGTLFGRNASAGALALHSQRPTTARTASLTLGLGDNARRSAAGVVNAPLSGDQLLARVAFTSETRDGSVENLVDGSRLNSRESAAARASLRWLPQPGTTVDLILNFQRDTPSGIAFQSSVIPTTRGDTSPFSAAELTRGAALGLDRTVWGATLLAEHTLSPHWTLHSVTAWRAYDSLEKFDIDGSRLPLLDSADDSRGRQFSQELRLNFAGDARWSAFVGASATAERARQTIPVTTDERSAWPFLAENFRAGLLANGVPAPLVATAVPAMHPLLPQTNLPAGFAAFTLVPPLAPLAGLAGAPLKSSHTDLYHQSNDLDAADVFADATWRATDRLELTAGARFSVEKQLAGYDAPANTASPSTLGFLLNASPNFAIAPSSGALTESDRSTGWSARALARYTVARDLYAFASVARGRRPATINLTATDRARHAEETLLNAELGVKGRTRDARVEWSASVFRYRYEHFQTFVQDPANLARFLLIDAGRAKGFGGEFALRAALTAHLSAFTTYGYTDATFDERGDDGLPQRFAGSTFRLTARHTAALGFTLAHSAGRAGVFTFTPRGEYKSAHFFDDDNTAAGGTLRQGGFALLHIRAGWTSPSRAWAITLYADNALDQNFLIDGGNTGASFGLPTFVRGAPRLLGLDVTRRW